MSRAYYNEHDKFAAQWLRNLISAGLIAPGDVDERDIRDIAPSDLSGYTQKHFFAGIGIWSLALRDAGWPDDRECWTGSAPCQPFSAAGRRNGFADERHLWPHWFHLIRVCRPTVIFGEQISSKDGLAWLDLIQSDLEGEGYAGGAQDICSAGVGSPNIRQRLYWVAHPANQRHEWLRSARRRRYGPADCGAVRSMADTEGLGLQRRPDDEHGWRRECAPGQIGEACELDHADSARLDRAREGTEEETRDQTRVRGPERGCPENELEPGTALGVEHPESDRRIERGSEPSERSAIGGRGDVIMGDAECEGRSGVAGDDGAQCAPSERAGDDAGRMADANGGDVGYGELQRGREYGQQPQDCGPGPGPQSDRPGPTNGFWRDSDWLLCTDGRWRPVAPGTFPLATGHPGRVGKLRAAGNALNKEVACNFIRSYIDACDDLNAED